MCSLPELTPPAHQVSNVGIAGSASAVVVSQPKTKWMPMDVSASAVDNYLGYGFVRSTASMQLGGSRSLEGEWVRDLVLFVDLSLASLAIDRRNCTRSHRIRIRAINPKDSSGVINTFTPHGRSYELSGAWLGAYRDWNRQHSLNKHVR